MTTKAMKLTDEEIKTLNKAVIAASEAPFVEIFGFEPTAHNKEIWAAAQAIGTLTAIQAIKSLTEAGRNAIKERG